MRCIFSTTLCRLVDDNVLVLPSAGGAASTPVDNSPYLVNVGSWLVNLPTMVSLSDWRVLLFH